jgi:recombination protein RecR
MKLILTNLYVKRKDIFTNKIFMTIKYPKELLTLISLLKKLPGVGQTTAERYLFQLLKWTEKDLTSLGQSVAELKKKINFCPLCGCIMENIKCSFCESSDREKSIICIISSPKDVYSIEQTKAFNGVYHVIANMLSPLNGYEEEGLYLDKLVRRINILHAQEVIIALDSTLEGDATALYIKKILEAYPVKISRLAFGIPIGSPLEYIDKGTLTQALCGRQKL